MSKAIQTSISLILALSSSLLLAEEKASTPRLQTNQTDFGKTPVLEQEQSLGNLNLEIKEKKRLKTGSKKDKKVRDSNGKILTMKETQSPRKNKEPHLVKQGKLTREQMDFRPKDKTEYAF